ncbi:MAG: YdjY domain-containing protein [Thermoguttaceae bacterium]|nr:YdjY domain-containing protein [Thermoguttaceae bacterium]
MQRFTMFIKNGFARVLLANALFVSMCLQLGTGIAILSEKHLLANEGQSAKTPRQFIPLVEQPQALRRLDPAEPVWVTPDRKQVVLGGEICLREGLLEFFACRTRSKEHESIVVLNIKPRLIHAALLVIGAKPGSPARFDPVFVPPSGEEIDIRIRWKDETGHVKELPAQELIREATSKKTMQVPWVFTGGLFGTDPEGKKYYLADISGEIFGVSNFPGSVLDVPFESSANNDNLYYEPNTPNIPAVGTPVTLLLTIKKQK